LSALPNNGVGLAREEFIISTFIKVHPLALLDYARLDNPQLKNDIDQLTMEYTDKAQFFVDRLAQGVGMIAAAFYPGLEIYGMCEIPSNVILMEQHVHREHAPRP
jgi:pyruvate,water dikinase